ncbi:MAG: transporter substrate-binding domain-containing protein [Alphaproteobacteria bacterium]|nr:transporter substrate-binding domain-containing protein [Alphaproteobacteria bacterium]
MRVLQVTWGAALALAIAVMVGAGAAAQNAPVPGIAEVRVATRVLPPMVVEENGGFTGFSIDLRQSIAARLQLHSAYTAAPNVGGLLELVRSGGADVGISAISITSAREAEFDFSLPMLNAGLEIMVLGSAGPASRKAFATHAARISTPVSSGGPDEREPRMHLCRERNTPVCRSPRPLCVVILRRSSSCRENGTDRHEMC